jgi:hypothetical protein
VVFYYPNDLSLLITCLVGNKFSDWIFLAQVFCSGFVDNNRFGVGAGFSGKVCAFAARLLVRFYMFV